MESGNNTRGCGYTDCSNRTNGYMFYVPKKKSKCKKKIKLRSAIFTRMHRVDDATVGEDLRICLDHFCDADIENGKIRKGALPMDLNDWKRKKEVCMFMSSYHSL